MKHGLLAAAIVLACAVASPTRAQSAAASSADALFREGRTLMKRGEFRAACPKFERSYQLDPAAGTAINLGDCFVQTGRLASALLAYQEAMRLLHTDDPRMPTVKAQVEALTPRVPQLVIRAKSDLPEGTKIVRDGRAVEASQLGAAVRLNPGSHVITVTAPGRDVARYDVALAEGDSRELVVEPAQYDVESSGQRRVHRSSGSPDADARSPSTVAYASAVLAVVGVAGFVGFGLAGNAQRSTLDACKPSCKDRDVYDAMKRDYLLANVSAVVALAAGAVSVYAFVQPSDSGAPSSSSARIIGVRGTW